MKSVKTKVVGLVVAALIFSLGFYSVLLYMNIKNITVAGREEHLSSLALTVCGETALWLDAKKAEMSAVADSIALTVQNKSFISSRIKLHARNNPTYEMVFYADLQGNSFNSSDKQANIADRLYFKQVLATGGAVVSDPVISRHSNQPIVVIAVPVKDGNHVTGVVGCAISLDSLAQRIIHIKVMKTGYAFVLQGDGMTIIHPDSTLVLKHNILKDASIDPALKDAVRKMVRRQAGLTKYVYKNVAKYVAFAPIPGINWSLAINAPVDEVLGQLSPIHKLITLMPIFVVIMASGLISFILIIFIVRPIAGLKDMMRRVKEGDLDAHVDYKSHDELGQLAESFNHMVKTIKEGRDKLLQSEEKYRTTLENIDEGLYEIDPAGNLIFLSNSDVFSSLGYPDAELMRMNYRNHMDPETANKVIQAFKVVHRTGQMVKNIDFDYIRADGSKITLETSVSLIRDARGQLIGYRGLVRDITDRKRAEDALAESEEKYRAIIEQFSDGLVLVDKQGKISDWNHAHEEISGLQREEVIGHPYWDVMMRFAVPEHRTPERIEKVKQATLEMLRTEQSPYIGENIEAQIIGTDGIRRYISQSVFPVKTAANFWIGSIVRDITARRQAEEAQRSSEQMIQSILSATPVGIGLSVDRKIKWVNETWMQIFGFKEESEFMDQPTKILYSSDESYEEARRRIFSSLEDSNVGKIEAVMMRKDKTTFYAYISTAPIDRSDLKKGTINTIVDISEWKKMEQSLRESEEKYRLAMDVTSDGLWDWDIPVGDVHYSPAWYRILGETIDQHISSWKSRLHPEERDTVFQSIANHWEGKSNSWSHEHRLKTYSGRWKWVLGRGSVISRDINGKPLRMIGTIIDIDERKLLESQLTQAQKMEAMGTLAGGIAHDFNNILGSIIGYTELSLMKAQGDDRQKNYLEQVMKASERAKNLVDQILVFSRQREQERKPVNVKIIVEEALKLLRASLPSTIEIRQSFSSDSLIVNADPTQIHQIIMNLCTNAAHAIHENVGVMDISVTGLEVSQDMVFANPDFNVASYVHLSVSDSGYGIDPSIMDKIYDPFFTTKKTGEGTGLGLSVVYGIVKKYEGVITVKSKLGEGTTFDIYLPRVAAESHVGKEEGNQNPFGGTERIFIIDDEEDLAVVLEKYLASIGYDAVSSTSSLDALECFRENPQGYDLIVTDMTMPHMTGLTLSREILALRPDIPIILCTGYDKSITREEAKTHGVREFALKPINPKILAGLIRKVLDE